MHVILGLLTALITILILLNRLAQAGIDLGGLNPFLYRRRKKWQQRYKGNPVYKLDDPMDLTALLMVALVKSEGDMSSEQKAGILSRFESEFHLSKRESSELLLSSVFLYGKGDEVRENLDKVIRPSLDSFNENQAESAIGLLEYTANIEGNPSEVQLEIINTARRLFDERFEAKPQWGQA